MIRSFRDVAYGFDFGPSEVNVSVVGGSCGDGYTELKTTQFSENIAACRSDPTCPTTTFTKSDIAKILIERVGYIGDTEAKAIGQLNDGRYFFITSWETSYSRANRAVVARELTGLVLFSLPESDRETIGWEILGA